MKIFIFNIRSLLATLCVILLFSQPGIAFDGCYPGGYTPKAGKIPKDQELDFSKLVTAAKRKGNLEDTLKELKKKNPEYLKFHTLMYCSPSLQKASYKEPRAIVFGPRADFIFTFNGKKSYHGGNALETVSIDAKSGKPLFREIAYRKAGEKWDDSLEPDEIDKRLSSKYVRVSKVNPQKCKLCHAANNNNKVVNTNWGSYFLWPCAYGSHDDILYDQFSKSPDQSVPFPNGNLNHLRTAKKPYSQSRLFELAPGVKDAELTGALDFLKGKDSHPRYSSLPDRVVDEPLRALLAGRKFNSLHYLEKFGKEGKRVDAGYGWPSRPNLFLLTRLDYYNRRKIISSALKLKGIKKFAPTLKWIEACGHPDPNMGFGAKGDPPEKLLEKVISKSDYEKMRKKIGSIEAFEKQFLENHLDIQTARINQFSGEFGNNSIRVREPYREGLKLNNYWSGSNLDFYRKKLGRSKFSPNERIAMNMEHANLNQLILAQYVLKYLGMDLNDHSMDFYQGGRSSVYNDGALKCAGTKIFEATRGKGKQSCDDLRAMSLSEKVIDDGKTPVTSDY